MSSPAAAHRARLVWGVWIVAAVVFAAQRTPFDDEWHSISLALDADWTTFWQGLSADRHPPWVALLDRLIAWVWPSDVALRGCRVAVAAGAVALYARAWASATSYGRLAVLLAAFHPIVFMYAGAARWYPFLFLAHGLRAWALWAAPGEPSRAAAFVGGAAVGSAASFVDPPFVVLDGLWLGWRARKEGRGWCAAATLPGAAISVAGVIWLVSPLGIAHGFSWAGWATGLSHGLNGMLTWAALGPAGEAHPPLPLLVLAALPAVGMLAGWLVLARHTRARPFAWWLLTTAALWALCAPAAAWHPRHSLSVWLLGAATLLPLGRTGRLWRLLAIGAAGYLAGGLALTVSGRSLLKADLNRLPVSTCARITAQQPDLLLAPYQRAAALITRTCRPTASVLAVSTADYCGRGPNHFPHIASAVPGHARVTLVTLTRASPRLADVQHRIRDMVSARCRLSATRQLAPVPHRRIKRWFDRGVPTHRFIVEDWRCPPAHSGH